MSIVHTKIFVSGHRMVRRKFSNVTEDNINKIYQASSPLALSEDIGYIQPSFGTLGGFFLCFFVGFHQLEISPSDAISLPLNLCN